MRISDWSSDVCSSDLADEGYSPGISAYRDDRSTRDAASWDALLGRWRGELATLATEVRDGWAAVAPKHPRQSCRDCGLHAVRSEEHTSALQSLMRISYAVLCLNKKIMTRPRQSLTAI